MLPGLFSHFLSVLTGIKSTPDCCFYLFYHILQTISIMTLQQPSVLYYRCGLLLRKLYMKISARMFGHEDVPLLGHGDMCVDFCNMYGTVPQHFLDVTDINVCFQKACGKGMPIQYNKDKSENPCKIKGFRDLSLFFFRLFFIKIRLCKVGRKGQCYINDKITATGNGGMNGKQKLDCLQRNHRCL